MSRFCPYNTFQKNDESTQMQSIEQIKGMINFTVIVHGPSLSPFPPPPQIRTPYRPKHLQRPASTFLNLSYIDLNDHGKPEV